jgi:hypothetical protein
MSPGSVPRISTVSQLHIIQRSTMCLRLLKGVLRRLSCCDQPWPSETLMPNRLPSVEQIAHCSLV